MRQDMILSKQSLDLDINSMQGKKNRPLLMENMNLMK